MIVTKTITLLSDVVGSRSDAGAPPASPYAALAVGTFGALIGGAFPVSVIFAMGDIGGGLSASADDAAWFTTLYNVGQLIGQPLLMILIGGLGRGPVMRLAGAGLAVTSLGVAIAPNLEFALSVRLLQGVFGGMLPTLMMLLVMTSPLPGRAKVAGLAAFSLSASLGVGIGAGLAAWLIGLGDWRMLFWGQVVAALIYLLLSRLVLRGERGDPRRLGAADWSSFLLVTLAVGLLAIGLGEGERRFWLESWWITASLACGLLAGAFAVGSLNAASNPLLRLEILSMPTLRWALILQLLFRFGLMVAIAVIPQYLARTQGFRIEQLGPLLALLALATLVTGPIAWWMACKFDPRISLSFGLACFALAAGRCVLIGPDWAAPEFVAPLIIIGVGQTFFGIAVLRFATWKITMREGPSVGVLFNFARIFGLVGGLAMASHIITEREKFHSARLGEALDILDPAVTQRLAGQSAVFANWLSDPAGSQRSGVAGLARAVSLQAYTQGYADAFTIIAVALLGSAVLVWTLPRLPAIPAHRR